MLDRIDPTDLLDQIGAAQSTTFIVKDLEHRFVYVNEVFARAVGLAPEDLVGRTDLEVGIPERMVLGDPATGWPGFWAIDDAVIASGRSQSFDDAGIEYASGGAHEAHTRRTPLRGPDGRVAALLVQSRDVSDVQDLRRRFRASLGTLRERDGEISALDSVVASLMECRDVASLFRRISGAILGRTHADGVAVFARHARGDRLECVATLGSTGASLAGATRRHGEGLVGRVWRERATLVVDDADAAGSLHRWGRPVRLCALPMIVDDDVVGVLCAVSGDRGADLREDASLLERIRDLASVAMANALLAEASAAALDRARALARLTGTLNEVRDVDDACAEVCRMLLPVVGVSRSSCYLCDAEGRLEPRSTWRTRNGTAERTDALGDADLIEESISRWSLDEGRIGLIRDHPDDPRESTRVHAARRRLNIGSTCAMPLLRNGRAIGALVISRERDRPDLGESEIELFRGVVNQLSAALSRDELAAALHRLAWNDPLTGLANRRRFENELGEALARARAAGGGLAVLFLDLDGFKRVNDVHGHAAGDALLARVARRLADRAGPDVALARMGGDEFALFVEHDASGACEDGAAGLAERLSAALVPAFDLDGVSVVVGTSVGIARFPDDGADVGTLLVSADLAMYRAKRGGRGAIVGYEPSLGAESRARASLERELRAGLERDEFELVWQPQVCCRTGRVVALEALVRWRHPVRGLLTPAEFVPVAEEAGLIDAIGTRVIDEAARRLADWRGTALDGVRACVNVAATQFRRDAFVDDVLETLARHGARAERLELEITESLAMTDLDSTVPRLERLRAVGARVAIDDFGTGHSSLARLQDLPLDVLKVDRSFVRRLDDGQRPRALLHSILVMATGLGLRTVVEGVETVAQRDAIVDLGADLIQGFVHARPVPEVELAATVARIEAAARVVFLQGRAA